MYHSKQIEKNRACDNSVVKMNELLQVFGIVSMKVRQLILHTIPASATTQFNFKVNSILLKSSGYIFTDSFPHIS